MNAIPETTVNLTRLDMPVPGSTPSNNPWGWHLALNLYDCDHKLITNAEVIRKFVIDLCELIEMQRFGEPMIVNFGENPRVSGYSLVQLIETSNVCGHFADESGAAYLDIFSCKHFDPEVATDFCIHAFDARRHSGVFINRD